jgi:rare lipoprotein A
MKNKIRLISSVVLFTLLAGCVNPHNKAAAEVPAHHVKIVKKTHPVTYRVFGKPYQVLPTSKNYQAKGVASWYGPHFHHRYTSSGERFNMYQLTAAHKTLPLATYVQVTNLENGRQVVVKVNDRGPFVGERLIDLSYAAAKKLGMVGQGITQVSIKALT